MLTDFGLAARIGDESAASGGSPFTSSPQQLVGSAPQVTDDIYSFGAMAYELLSGYPPFYPDADSRARGDRATCAAGDPRSDAAAARGAGEALPRAASRSSVRRAQTSCASCCGR